jgi:putative ABC transport system permease protein
VIVQFTLAWRYLRGRGIRTLLTTLAVVLGVTVIFGLNGLLPAFLQAFNSNLLSTAGKLDVTITSTFNEEFPITVVDTVSRVPGMAVAAPEIQRIAPLAPIKGVPTADQVAQINVIGIDPATAVKVRDFPLQSGRTIASNDVDTAVLNSDLAAKLHVGLGGTIDLPSSVGTTKFTVVGLLSTATLPGQELVYVPLTSAQTLFAFPQKVNTIEGTFLSGVDHAVVEADLRKALGSGYQIGGASNSSTLLASIGTASAAFNIFGIFALITGGFIILNSFRTVVAERRHDVGMLRAIGAKRGTIVGMFLVESVFQGILGTGIGIICGYGMAWGLIAAINPFYSAIVHVTIAGPVFEASTWVMAIVLGVGVTIAAAILPARAAGRVTPMDAMRPQVGEVYERTVGRRAWIGLAMLIGSLVFLATANSSLIGFGAILFLIGITLVAPVIVNPLANYVGVLIEVVFAREGAIARSNLQRNPARSATTVTAVMLGLASIVAILGIVVSIFTAFYGYIDKSLSADYMFIPQSIILSQGNVAAGPRLAEEVRHTPGIRAVGTMRLGRGKVNGTDVQVLGIDPKTYPTVAAFDWSPGSSNQALGQLSSGRWIITNGIYAATNHVTIGQAIVIDTPDGPRTYYVAGVGNDYLNAKLSTLYVSQDNLARDFNVTSDLLIMADRSPTADPATVLSKLDVIAAQFPAFHLYESAQWKAAQVAIFDQTYVIFYGLVAALALPSLLALVNTLAISVLARTREIGMLRAVGSTRAQVRRMVMAESLLLSAIGTALGVVAGIWLGYALVVATNASTGFNVPYAFPWSGIVVTVIVGMGFGVLAALIPSRSAARLNVVDALHFE